MKFKYTGKFPMWLEIKGTSKLLNTGDIVESEKDLGQRFEWIDKPAPKPAPKPRKKRSTIDASSTETSSVW